MKFPRATGLRGVPALMVLAMARLVERKPAAQYAVAQRSLLVSKCTPGAKDADHTVIPVAALAGCKVRGERANDFGGGMQRARGQCRQMSERAPSAWSKCQCVLIQVRHGIGAELRERLRDLWARYADAGIDEHFAVGTGQNGDVPAGALERR